MADIITPANRAYYADLLDDMHRMRYRVVVKEWGWDIPGIAQGYDKDDFDGPDTVYIVETDPDRRRVLACARLNPTEAPHMMTELFSGVCDLQDIPRGANVWECSRFVVDRRAFTDRNLETQTRRRLGVGITEFCLSAGIDRLSWFTHQAFYNLILIVWETSPLGLPKTWSDGQVYIPAVSTIDRDALARQRARLEQADQAVTFTYLPISAVSDPFGGRRAA
jgi:acyl-homoserine lactone synthase